MNGNWNYREGCFGGDASLRRKSKFWPERRGQCGNGGAVGIAGHILIDHKMRQDISYLVKNFGEGFPQGSDIPIETGSWSESQEKKGSLSGENVLGKGIA